MRKAIDIILTLNLLFLLTYVVYLWWSGQVVIQYVGEPDTTVTRDTNEAAFVFRQTLQEAVNQQIGQPIEGYEPQMLLDISPGLVTTDFEGVEASIGKYVVVEGQLVHVTPPGALLHSAAPAITRVGFTTLLSNVSTRNQIDLGRDGTITEVMSAISTQ